MIVAILTFLVNIIVVSAGIDFYQLFSPIQSPWLVRAFAYLQWSYTPHHVSVALEVGVLLASAALAHTPPMQWLLCRINGCRTPNGEERQYLENIMDAISQRNGMDRSRFNLYVSNADMYNAFAIGHNNICVTRKMLNAFPALEIAGVLAHEIGHIVHKDTAYGISVYAFSWVGQLTIQIYLWIARVLQIFLFIPLLNIAVMIFIFVINLQIVLFSFLLGLPLQLATFFDSRQREYSADRYACEIGLGEALYSALSALSAGEQSLPWQTRLLSTHPATRKRLERIQRYLARGQ